MPFSTNLLVTTHTTFSKKRGCPNSMVSVHVAIVKFILSLQLEFSAPQIGHLISIVNGIILCEGRKNISTIRDAAGKPRHLSSTTRFLNESPWSVNRMQRRRMERIMQHIRIIVTTHVVSEGQSYAWDYRPYFREKSCEEQRLEFKSKNELAMEMIATFSTNENECVYVLADSWYTSRSLLDACNARGFHVIAAVKANRIICPAGIRTSMSDFAAKYIDNPDLRSVPWRTNVIVFLPTKDHWRILRTFRCFTFLHFG